MRHCVQLLSGTTHSFNLYKHNVGLNISFTDEETEPQRGHRLSPGHYDFVPDLSAEEPLFETTRWGSGSPYFRDRPAIHPAAQGCTVGEHSDRAKGDPAQAQEVTRTVSLETRAR